MQIKTTRKVLVNAFVTQDLHFLEQKRRQLWVVNSLAILERTIFLSLLCISPNTVRLDGHLFTTASFLCPKEAVEEKFAYREHNPQKD